MSGASLRVRAASGARWTFLSTLVGVGTQGAQLVVLSRLLAPRDFGLMGILLVVSGFALAYTDLGISAAIVQRRDATAEQLSSLYWTNVAVGVLVGAVVWSSAPAVARFFGTEALLAPLRALVALFLIVPLGKQFEMLLQRELAFAVLARTEMVSSVFGAAVAIGAALLGAGAWALVAGALATAAARAAQLVAIGWRRFRPALHFRRDDLRGYLGFGLYQLGEQSINYLGERLDQLLIGRLLGIAPLGLYNFAHNLTSQPVSRINPVVTRVAFPAFCEVQEDTARLRAGFLRMVGMLATVNAPVLAGLAAVAPLLVPLVFGRQWQASVPLVRLLCLLALFRSIGNPLGSVLLARGRADLGFRLNVLLIALNVPAVVLGARLGGTSGIVIGLLTVQLALLPLCYVWLLRPLLGPCGREYAAAIGRPVALAVLMACVVGALEPLARDAAYVAPVLVAQVLLGAVVYVGVLLLADREGARQLVALAGARS